LVFGFGHTRTVTTILDSQDRNIPRHAAGPNTESPLGDRDFTVHVTTDKDAIPEVLSAFATPFNLRYRTAVPLNWNVSSEYSGSLAYVISRLLGGYDYVTPTIKERSRSSLSGKHGEALAPVQRPVSAPGPGPVSTPGLRVSDVSVDPGTYPTCMALFREAAGCAEMMKRLNGSSQ
jgi:hypothetical protein